MARTLWKALVTVLVAAAAVVAVTAVGMAPAGAANPLPITDYANYPLVTPSIIPDGCTTDAAAITVGEQFTVTLPGEAPEVVTNLRDIAAPTMVPGTVIDMTWTGFAPGCEGAGISLSTKRAAGPTFRPDVAQTLIASSYEYCGPQDDACTLDGGVYRLSITLPPEASCYYQVDAVVGPPLATVWNANDAEGNPLGSFYSDDTRVANGRPGGFNMLISAANGGLGDCEPPPCEYDPTLPADDPSCYEPCEYDPTLPADDPSCYEPCEYDPTLPADDPSCYEPCEYDPTLPADDPGCVPPPEPCEYDPTLPADDPGCVPPPEPCEYDPTLPADDPGCVPPPEPCEYDPTLPADDPGCVPPPEPCEYDPTLPADDADCVPPPEVCPDDPTKAADDPTCGEVVQGNVVRPTGQLPRTGGSAVDLVDPAGLLLGLGVVLVLVARRRSTA